MRTMNFPINEINNQQSVLCLFCAAFGGENDVQHLRKAGFKKVTLVDNDINKLVSMIDWFQYNVVCSDSYQLIDILIKNGIHYDVIITDQWTDDDALIHDTYFEKLETIANDVLILGISKNYLNQVETPKGKYYKRSNHKGGVYWRVVHKH